MRLIRNHGGAPVGLVTTPPEFENVVATFGLVTGFKTGIADDETLALIILLNLESSSARCL